MAYVCDKYRHLSLQHHLLGECEGFVSEWLRRRHGCTVWGESRRTRTADACNK